MKLFKISTLLIVTFVIFLVVPVVIEQGHVFAQTGITNPAIGDLGNDPTEAQTGVTFGRYFASLWLNIITIGALLLLIYFIWGAIEWITAGGDSGKVGKARDRIVNSIIGMIILAGSFVIIGFIGRVFFADAFCDIRVLDFVGPGGKRGAACGKSPAKSDFDILKDATSTTLDNK